jgi:acetyl esterase/lipase
MHSASVEPKGGFMSRRDLIDPEVREPLDQLLQANPGGFNSIPDIVQRRAIVTQLLAALEIPPNPNVTSADRTVPGPEGAPDIKVRIYRPAEATGTLPGIYYIHGGGMILGDIDGEVATEICERVDAVVVSVEYRLAPEHPYPAPVEDCYAGLVWMARNASELRFDPDRLADLFRDEDIAFATRLMQAGVPTELHVNPGAYHAAEVFAPEAALSQRIWARRIEALRRGLA